MKYSKVLNKTNFFVVKSRSKGEFSKHLVVWVVDHGRFPFSVHLIVPIFGLGGFWIGNVLRLVPIFGLFVIGICNGWPVIPIFRFRLVGVFDFLGGKEVPVGFQFSRFNVLVVDENLEAKKT